MTPREIVARQLQDIEHAEADRDCMEEGRNPPERWSDAFSPTSGRARQRQRYEACASELLAALSSAGYDIVKADPVEQSITPENCARCEDWRRMGLSDMCPTHDMLAMQEERNEG